MPDFFSTPGLAPHIPEIVAAVRRSGAVMLEAAPGSGKTTLVPPALLAIPELQGKIIVLQPRRVAAWSVAKRMAELAGEELGKTIGFRVRGESKVSGRTRVEVVTEGVFLRMIENDPFLEGVGAVVFDEFHERSVDSDVALTLAADVRSSVRADLKLVVMSATLGAIDLEPVIPGIEVLRFDGERHPVEIRYRASSPDDACGPAMASTVASAIDELDGDVLGFLPGVREIERVLDTLATRLAGRGLELLPLYGELPYEEQRRAILPSRSGKRRVVLSTPIAETSVTIEGVRVVVDSGFARVSRFDPGRGFSRLERERITKAQAVQRAGRSGRTAPGVCIRLWSADLHETLRAAPDPEITGGDLSSLALTLAAWGKADLRWLDQPPRGALEQASSLLRALGAVDPSGGLTTEGRALHALGTHPRLGTILLRGAAWGALETAASIVALLEERDPFAAGAFGCDLAARVEALAAFERSRRAPQGAARGRLERIATGAARWRDRVKNVAAPPPGGAPRAGVLVAAGFPERMMKRREGGGFLMASGRAAVLPPDDLLAREPYLAAAELSDRERDALVRLAAPISSDELDRWFPGMAIRSRVVEWDDRNGGIRAAEETRIGALVLESRRIERPDPDEILDAVKRHVLAGGVSGLPWSPEARELQARVRFARTFDPDYPDLSDDAIAASFDTIALPFLHGVTRATDLAKLDVKAILRGALSYKQLARLDADFPESMSLKGRSRRLSYVDGELPVLEATVQDLLGLPDTPRLCGGRAPILLHILSPARRPIQVTRDLAAFWRNTYAEVRKELRGRYPKHRWPENPLERDDA